MRQEENDKYTKSEKWNERENTMIAEKWEEIRKKEKKKKKKRNWNREREYNEETMINVWGEI